MGRVVSDVGPAGLGTLVTVGVGGGMGGVAGRSGGPAHARRGRPSAVWCGG